MGAAVYDGAVRRFVESLVDWENDDMRVMLLSPDYLPDQAADVSVGDVRRFEVAPSGTYRRGGTQLRGRSVEHDPVSHRMRLLAGDVGWQEFTGAFRFAVVYQAADAALVTYTDFGVQEARNASVSINFPDGVCDFEVAPAFAS